MKSFYLYKITNLVNEKVYLGITARPKQRLKEHFSKSSSCSKLSRAINKHGKDNFIMTILCEGTEDYIIDLESKAIKVYDSINNGYNLMDGHPNKNGTIHSEESKLRISEALLEYYKNNVCKNLGAERLSKRDLNPYYITGFWFPTKRVALKALQMNQKSFYKWRSDGTLGEVCHPAINSKSHQPVYVLGLWFNSLIDASVILNKDKNFLLMILNKNLFEEDLGTIGSKIRLKPQGVHFGVNKRENGNYRTVFRHQKEKIFDRTYRNLEDALAAYDDCYESVHGLRPNNTIKELEVPI